MVVVEELDPHSAEKAARTSAGVAPKIGPRFDGLSANSDDGVVLGPQLSVGESSGAGLRTAPVLPVTTLVRI